MGESYIFNPPVPSIVSIIGTKNFHVSLGLLLSLPFLFYSYVYGVTPMCESSIIGSKMDYMFIVDHLRLYVYMLLVCDHI